LVVLLGVQAESVMNCYCRKPWNQRDSREKTFKI
jgi:hypothetical protein